MFLDKPFRCRQGHITLADTFVADGEDDDLLFYFHRDVAGTKNLVQPWTSAYGGFPDKAAL
jgi:hypothetical protein